MKKVLIGFFYLIAFIAVSYFLREYLSAPRSFIISLIASLAVILILITYKSRYTTPIGVTLIVFHALWLIGHFIPVYNHKPDIRQRYRRSPSMLRSVPGATSGTKVTLVHNGDTFIGNALSFGVGGMPVYQGNTITTAGPSIATNERMMLTFRDSSHIQLFPQTSIIVETLAPDFSLLTGSRIGVILERGIISATTYRNTFQPQQRYIKANTLYFSCRECIVGLSGTAGSISSMLPFTWRVEEGEKISLSGGVYTFTQNSISASSNKSSLGLLDDTRSASENQKRIYHTMRQSFIRSERGWSMDTSVLLSYTSKVKMALVGLIDRTYREKYNNLTLYEYLRGDTNTLPPPFASQASVYEFIQ